MRPSRRPRRPRPGRGFTLIELLVVVAIIVLVTAATIPILLPLLDEQEVNQAARILQAEIYKVRDAAVRGNAPAGIRLVPDETFQQIANNAAGSGSGDAGILAAGRMIDIEPAPDYTEGKITHPTSGVDIFGNPSAAANTNGPFFTFLAVYEAKFDPTTGAPNAPASWYWNIRVGEKIRFGDSGRVYTIAGPDYLSFAQPGANPERFVNAQIANPQGGYTPGPNTAPEFLVLVNGEDDNGDGYIDNGFDGIDNDNDGAIDDATEWTYTLPAGKLPWVESETFPIQLFTNPNYFNQQYNYTIIRRPVPTQGAQEVALPPNVVIDMTTWNAPFNVAQPSLPQRSRLPVDPLTHYVDILIGPNGQVVPSIVGQDALPPLTKPYYHFWLCRREDVFGALFGLVPNSAPLPTNWVPVANPNWSVSGPFWLLPYPKKTPGYDVNPNGTSLAVQSKYLTKDHRLVTLFTKTGLVTSRLIDVFDPTNIELPYLNAQQGVRDEP